MALEELNIDYTKEELEHSIDVTNDENATGGYSTAYKHNSTASLDGGAVPFLDDASATEDYATAIGFGSTASGERSLAEGYGAVASGTDSIQIGQGENTIANTAKIFNTQILNANGKVPFGSLEKAQKELVAGRNVTLTDNQDGTTTISASGGSGGTSDYSDLDNKPSVNSVTLVGNKTLADLGAQDKLTAGSGINIDNNVISSKHDYSTNEQVIGAWIDGKPLYEKTITINNIASNSSVTYDISDIPYDTIVHLSGVGERLNNDSIVDMTVSIPQRIDASNLEWAIWLRSQLGEIVIKTTGAPSALQNAYITIQYTKTTDTAQ